MVEPVDVRQHILYKRDTERTLKPEVAQRMLDLLDEGAMADYQALLVQALWPEMLGTAFHTAPRAVREVILTEGLKPCRPSEGNWKRLACEISQPEGVYVATLPDEMGMWAHWSEWDVWQVDATDLPREADRLNPGSWVITCVVPPDRLTLWEKP